MKVFDCFMYFDEDLLLDIRLHALDKYVDFFIIVESKYNHKTQDKEEFLTLKFIPPCRVCIYKGTPETARYIQILDHI